MLHFSGSNYCQIVNGSSSDTPKIDRETKPSLEQERITLNRSGSQSTIPGLNDPQLRILDFMAINQANPKSI
jgi:hypothetical protein